MSTSPTRPRVEIQIHASGGSRVAKSAKRENPGDFFHPLLGNSDNRRCAADARHHRAPADSTKDWIGSFATPTAWRSPRPQKMPLKDFEKRVRKVCAWFDRAEPVRTARIDSQVRGSELLDEMHQRRKEVWSHSFARRFRPNAMPCSTSTAEGEPIIRKASAHGLGHLLSPYDDKDKPGERESGVRSGRRTYGRKIIRSLRSANPVEFACRLAGGIESIRRSANIPPPRPTAAPGSRTSIAASRYAQSVKPFNFLWSSMASDLTRWRGKGS